jgi:hypothetical protein
MSDTDQYEIRAATGKFYGGGAVYKAIHKRCHKVIYLTAQMVSSIRHKAGVRR